MLEKRKHQRIDVVFGSDIDLGPGSSKIGLTQDVSLCGARLFTFVPVGTGTPLSVRIVMNDKAEARVDGAVVREQRIEDRGIWKYEIGVAFDTLLSDQVLHLLQRLQEARA